MDLGSALRTAVRLLGEHGAAEARTLTPAQLEVAVLDRTREAPRKFRRIANSRLEALLAG